MKWKKISPNYTLPKIVRFGGFYNLKYTAYYSCDSTAFSNLLYGKNLGSSSSPPLVLSIYTLYKQISSAQNSHFYGD